MKFNKFLFVLTILFFSTFIAALHAEDQKDDLKKSDLKKNDLKIGGKIYAQYYYELQDSDNSDDTAEKNFSVTRAYIKLKKNIGGPFSIHITADALQLKSSDSVDITDSGGDAATVDVKPETPYYDFFLKNAFIMGKEDFGAVNITGNFGLIGTPIIGLSGKLSDYRWIYNDFIDKSKNLTGTSIDTSTDLGLSVKADIMKIVTLTGAYCNGEGYKHVAEDARNSGKSVYGLVSITPFKGLFLNGFIRNENKEVDNSAMEYTKKDSRYYGGGLALKSDILKAGFNYIPRAKNEEDGKKTTDITLLDIWLHANFNSAVGVPVLLLGRYAKGEDKKSDIKTTYIGGGLGYQFNKNFRVAAYYEEYKNDSFAEGKQKNVYIKTEAKF